MTKSNPKLQLQTLKEVAVCSQYASINARLNSNGEISGRLQVLWQDQDSSGRGSGLKIIVDNNTTLFLSYDKFEAIK